MSETTAIFGGSFDPPHVGHVMAVQYVLLTAPVQRVLVVPCAHHPFGKRQASFEHRCEMCRLAFGPLGSRVEVLDVEGGRSGPSYTIDTVSELAERMPGVRLELIVGSDIVDEMPRWKGIDELRRLAALRVLPRLDDNTAAAESDQAVPFYLPRVSGVSLRRMMAEGKDVSARIPRAVLDYIAEHGLYGQA